VKMGAHSVIPVGRDTPEARRKVPREFVSALSNHH